MTHKSMLSCVATEKPMTQNTVTEAIKIANKTTVCLFGAKISWERKHPPACVLCNQTQLHC